MVLWRYKIHTCVQYIQYIVGTYNDIYIVQTVYFPLIQIFLYFFTISNKYNLVCSLFPCSQPGGGVGGSDKDEVCVYVCVNV